MLAPDLLQFFPHSCYARHASSLPTHPTWSDIASLFNWTTKNPIYNLVNSQIHDIDTHLQVHSVVNHTLPLVKGLRIGSVWNSLSLCWCLSLLLLVMLQAAPKSKGVTHSFAELSSGGLPISRPHPWPPNPQTVSVRAHHSRPTQPTAPPAAQNLL